MRQEGLRSGDKAVRAPDERRLRLEQIEAGMIVELVHSGRGEIDRFEVTGLPIRADNAKALAAWRDEHPNYCMWLESLNKAIGVGHMIGFREVHFIPTVRKFGNRELFGLELACDLGLEPFGHGGQWHENHYVRRAQL